MPDRQAGLSLDAKFLKWKTNESYMNTRRLYLKLCLLISLDTCFVG